MTVKVTAPKKGEPIRARFLGKMASNQNELLEYVQGPLDLNGGRNNAGDDVQNERGKRGKRGPQGAKGDPGSAASISGSMFEVRRSTSTVRITSDTDENVFVDVERIDSVTLEGVLGRIRLVFDND